MNKEGPSNRSPELLAALSELGLPSDAPQLGSYVLGHMLGQDDSAVVHLAIDARLARAVAIKRLRPEAARDPAARARFQHEAQVLGYVESRGIVRLYQAELDAPEPYLVMELIAGQTLRDFSRAFSPLSPPPVMIILCELARTLIPLHEAGLVHCGLRLSRVLIHSESEGRLVLLGFDQTVILDEPDGETLLTPEECLLIGPDALAYVAPELVLGQPVGVKADQFSLAVMAYELLTGRRPFEGRTVATQLDLIRRQQYPRPREVDPRVPEVLAEAIERGLSFDPDERWPSVHALAQALEQGLRQDGFEDPSVELCPLLARTPEFLGTVARRVGEVLGQKALVLAAQGDTMAAAAACRRALAWWPEQSGFKELLAKLQPGSNGGHPQGQKMLALLAADPIWQAQALVEEPADVPPATTPEPGLVPESRPSVAGAESPDPDMDREAKAAVSMEPAPVTSPPARRRWVRAGLAAGALLAGVLCLVLSLRPARVPSGRGRGGASGLADVLRAPLKVRPGPPRLQEPTLAKYLPPPPEDDGQEGGAPRGPRPAIDLEGLGRLEKRGDLHGLAMGSLLKGGPGSVEQALATLGEIAPLDEAGTGAGAGAGGRPAGAPAPSRHPDIDSDRSALLLLQKRPAEAFSLTVRVLEAVPHHAGAEWNQALALQDLGMTQGAAAAFGRIQASGEPGWSAEAGMRRSALIEVDDKRRHAYEEVLTQGKAMVAGGPVPVGLAAVSPGYLRLFFYDAMRTATSPARVRELLPLAEILDRYFRGDVLERYVRRIAARPFARRAQLAGVYAQLVANPKALSREAQEDYFAALRAAGEWDLLFGALLHTRRVGDHLPEYEELTRATEDPWFALLSENERANADMARGEHRLAEDRLLAALRTCQEQGMELRCVRLEISLVRLYISQYALHAAEEHATQGLALARKTGNWGDEVAFLGYLGEIAYYRNDFSLGRVYIDETERREPARCERERFVHEWRAFDHAVHLEYEEARREAMAVPLCGEPRSLLSFLMLATLNRVGLPVEPPDETRKELAALRRQKRWNPNELALATHTEGLFAMQSYRGEGRALLKESIAMVKRLPSPDAFALKILTDSYQELSLDAAQAGDPEAALAVMAEQRGLPSPRECVLGALVSDERMFVVSRGADGVIRQRYEAPRPNLDMDLARFIPEDIRAGVARCSQVAVFAHPVFHADGKLLPPEMVWSFREGSFAPVRARTGPSHQLVVQGIEPPPGFGLRPLGLWGKDIIPSPLRTVLQGLTATPSNVLTEMQSASEVIFQTHALAAGELAYLLLSPGADDRYTLTADAMLQRPFKNAPVVILAHWPAAETSYRYAITSMPMVLRQAGAGPVFAVVGRIPDGEGEPFFDMVLERIRAGQSPAVALRDMRMIWLKEKHREWVTNVVLSE